MKIQALFVIGIAVGITSCGEQEPAAPAEDIDTGTALESAMDEMPTAVDEGMGSETFIRHMHLHATHLDGLNEALAAGDLEAAQTPAHWLLRHEEVTGHPEEWQPHIDNMRDAARSVAEAADITAARTAAQRITESCNSCHAAAGIRVDLSGLSVE